MNVKVCVGMFGYYLYIDLCVSNKVQGASDTRILGLHELDKMYACTLNAV